MQKSSRFEQLQKGFIELDIPHKNLKQESFYLSNSIRRDLILVGN